MEEDKSKPPSLPDDTQLKELSNRVAKNVIDFRKFMEKTFDVIQDKTFPNLTKKSYNQKKVYMKSHVQELSNLHKSLADECNNLIDDVSKHHQSSDSSSLPKVNQSLAPNFTKATGYELVLNPSGFGFYLSKVKGSSSHSGSEDSTSPVNDDDLKVEENNEELLKKISNLKQIVASLTIKLQSVTEENDKLNQEIEDDITYISAYMSANIPKFKEMKEELETKKESGRMINELMCKHLDEKIITQAKHDSEKNEMGVKMNAYENKIARLKSKHEKEEKIWDGITDPLKEELKEKSESLADVVNKIEALIVEKSDQNSLIHKLKTELAEVKLENAGLVPSFEEDVKRITGEIKLNVVELGKVMDKRLKAISRGVKK